jgi:hypothetical protein
MAGNRNVSRGLIVGIAIALWIAIAMPADLRAQDARIEMELVMEPGFPTDQARKWIALLEKAGVSGVRVRGGNVGDSVQVEPTGTARNPSYRVTGILTLDEKLLLPSGKYTASDAAGVARWVARLKEGGTEGLSAKPGAFGLLPAQLVATHEGLAGKINFSTKGTSPRDVVEKIADSLSLKLSIDAASQRALAASEPVADELQGLSQGTVLAAAIRPAGLVLVPVKDGGQVQLRITDSKSVKESWPIGWPMPSGKGPKDYVPDLMKFIPVEINDTPLGEAVTAIAGRLKVPVVLDYNALARQRVDLAETKVTFPKGKTFYGSILSKLLFQAKLKYELRLDEADQPFLWITSVAGN